MPLRSTTALELCVAALVGGLSGYLIMLYVEDVGHDPKFSSNVTLVEEVQPVFSDDLGVEEAEELFVDKSIGRDQRNEAADALRRLNPRRFLQLAKISLDDVEETSLFRSWIVQHVGLLADEMPRESAIGWAGTLESMVESEAVGSPLWRESVYAWSMFPQGEAQDRLRRALSELDRAEYEDNRDILSEIGVRRTEDALPTGAF